MLLVLFAVVLILSAFQGEGSMSGAKFNFECSGIASSAGSILCKLHGSKDMTAYRPKLCQVSCYDPNQRLQLAPAVCRRGRTDCPEDLKNSLLKWKDDMEKVKENLKNEWCSR